MTTLDIIFAILGIIFVIIGYYIEFELGDFMMFIGAFMVGWGIAGTIIPSAQ